MDNSLKITALQPNTVVDVLKRSGSQTATEALISDDLEAGAPMNADGTINLIEFAAWLLKEDADGSDTD